MLPGAAQRPCVGRWARDFFTSMMDPSHRLHCLLPEKRTVVRTPRKRKLYPVIRCSIQRYQNSFVPYGLPHWQWGLLGGSVSVARLGRGPARIFGHSLLVLMSLSLSLSVSLPLSVSVSLSVLSSSCK